jgi:hypothetical protein
MDLTLEISIRKVMKTQHHQYTTKPGHKGDEISKKHSEMKKSTLDLKWD